MFQVGLTGGIGSGKSIIAQVFKVLGIAVFDADIAAKNIMEIDENLKQNIIKTFGEESYINEKLNRPFIANIVFNDNHKLELLNNIVHPATINLYNNWVQQQTSDYVIKEAALMFEAGSTTNLDLIIGVYAPKHLRLKRAINRDGSNKEQIESRMKNQIEETIKMKLCDVVIINDEQKLVIEQVLQLHYKILDKIKN